MLGGRDRRLGEDFIDQFAVDVGQSVSSSLVLEGQSAVVDAQAVQQRGIQVVDVDGVFQDVVRVVVGGAVRQSRLDAGSGDPGREASRMVVAAVVGLGQSSLAVDGSAEFSTPDDERILE